MEKQEREAAAIRAILADYRRGREIDAIAIVPGRERAAELTGVLRNVLHPGTARDGEAAIREGMARLTEEVTWALQLAGQPLEASERRAEAVCLEFFRGVPALREAVRLDLLAAEQGDPAASSLEEILLAYPGMYAVTVYRMAHSLHRLGTPLLPRMMTEHAHSVTGIDLHPGAEIGASFFIDHGTGVVVGETAVIGDHGKLYQGVTLGALSTRGGQSLRGKKRHPTLEDSVTVYANATILGGDTVIGRGRVIPANAFITASVPPAGEKALAFPPESGYSNPGDQ